MATQYADASALPSSTYRDFVLSYVGPFDHYVIFQSGQYQYTGYIWNRWGKHLTITFNRASIGNYNYRWESSVSDSVTSYSIREPMYAYSTDEDLGVYFAPPSIAASGSIASLILSCTIAVLFIFRGVWSLCGGFSRRY